MKYLIYFFAILILAGIQIGFFSYFKFFGAVPDVLLLFVIGCCLQREADDAFFVALVAGLFADFLNGVFVGSFTISFLLLALCLYLIIHHLVVFELNWKYLLAVVVVSGAFVGGLSWAISNLAFHAGWSFAAIDFSVLKSHIIPRIIYTLVLAYPLYALATWLREIILSMQGKKYRIL